jgi:hypothetical protein
MVARLAPVPDQINAVTGKTATAFSLYAGVMEQI